jgi:hypothetical protein
VLGELAHVLADTDDPDITDAADQLLTAHRISAERPVRAVAAIVRRLANSPRPTGS